MALKAAPPRVKGKSKGKGGGLLEKRIGGIPLPFLLVGVAAAIGLGLYLRHRSASTASSAQSATPASTSDTGSGAGGSGAVPADLTPVEDLAQSINGLIPYLGAGSGSLTDTGAFTTSPQSAPAASTTSPTFQFLLPSSQTTAPTSSPATSPASSPVAPTVQILGPTGQVQTVAATPETNQIAAYENPPGPDASAAQQQAAQAAAQASIANVNLFPATPPPATVTPTPPTYGITSGPPAGERATKKPGRGAISVH